MNILEFKKRTEAIFIKWLNSGKKLPINKNTDTVKEIVTVYSKEQTNEVLYRAAQIDKKTDSLLSRVEKKIIAHNTIEEIKKRKDIFDRNLKGIFTDEEWLNYCNECISRLIAIKIQYGFAFDTVYTQLSELSQSKNQYRHSKEFHDLLLKIKYSHTEDELKPWSHI